MNRNSHGLENADTRPSGPVWAEKTINPPGAGGDGIPAKSGASPPGRLIIFPAVEIGVEQTEAIEGRPLGLVGAGHEGRVGTAVEHEGDQAVLVPAPRVVR